VRKCASPVRRASLANEDALQRCLVERIELLAPPGRICQQHPASLGVADLGRIDEARERLVQVVQRHPSVVEREGAGLDPARAQLVPERDAARHAADIAGAELVLALGESPDERSPHRGRLLIARGGEGGER
jgi:hypothetical protein